MPGTEDRERMIQLLAEALLHLIALSQIVDELAREPRPAEPPIERRLLN